MRTYLMVLLLASAFAVSCAEVEEAPSGHLDEVELEEDGTASGSPGAHGSGETGGSGYGHHCRGHFGGSFEQMVANAGSIVVGTVSSFRPRLSPASAQPYPVIFDPDDCPGEFIPAIDIELTDVTTLFGEPREGLTITLNPDNYHAMVSPRPTVIDGEVMIRAPSFPLEEGARIGALVFCDAHWDLCTNLWRPLFGFDEDGRIVVQQMNEHCSPGALVEGLREDELVARVAEAAENVSPADLHVGAEDFFWGSDHDDNLHRFLGPICRHGRHCDPAVGAGCDDEGEVCLNYQCLLACAHEPAICSPGSACIDGACQPVE